MIREVKITNNRITFAKQANKPEKTIEERDKEKESKILPNTIQTRIRTQFDRTSSAITEYPVKGFKGDVNSDFYEFLSMGIVPYIAGSAMFIAMFNLVNKHLTPKASLIGKKMGLGVLLCMLGKNLTGDLVTRPVAIATGVDIEQPYTNVYTPLPTGTGSNAQMYPKRQQRKIYDSIEFFRKDLISADPKYGKGYYDRIAKKIGLGENLNDSVTEVTPIIQGIVSATKTAKSLSTYAWAGVGVGLAAQNCWADFFNAFTNREKYISKTTESFLSKAGGKLKTAGKNTIDLTKTFGKTFGNACKTYWSGEAGSKGFMKHMGKAWLLFTVALTAGTTANVIYRARHLGKLANKDLMDRNTESTVI